MPSEQIYAAAPPPAIVDAMEKLVASCARHGKVAGNAAFEAGDLNALLERGIRFVPVAAATSFLTMAAKRELALCRRIADTFSEAGAALQPAR